MIVKVCGMRDPQNIRAVEALGVDWIGFIFHPHSPRYVERIPDYLPSKAARVGVFVNASVREIVERTERFGLNAVQMHGHESPDFCCSLRGKLPAGTILLKALPVADSGDMERAMRYQDCCDYLLFETPSPAYGGSGRQFDWSLTDRYSGSLPFILSGGIGPGSIAALRTLHHPRWAGIDLNSRFETEPGIKDTASLQEFITELKNTL